MSGAAFPPPGYPAPPSPFAGRLFDAYVRRQAKRHLAGVHWLVRGRPNRRGRDLPTVFVANHTNWWDGFLASLVTHALGLRFQVLMEAKHLQRYRVFLRVGALPLRRHRPREAYADLHAAASYLLPGSGLWVFPQGARRPPAEPLARCERGAAHLAEIHGGPIRFCPVAFRYAFVGEQLPEAFVLVGGDWIHHPRERRNRAARSALMDVVVQRLSETVATLDRMVGEERLTGFEPLARGRLSVNKRLDRFRHAVGLLGGRFEARNG